MGNREGNGRLGYFGAVQDCFIVTVLRCGPSNHVMITFGVAVLILLSSDGFDRSSQALCEKDPLRLGVGLWDCHQPFSGLVRHGNA